MVSKILVFERRISMAFHRFNELPTELRLTIFRCCSKKDWFNIALTCKQCRNEVQQFTWESLEFSWDSLESYKNVHEYKNCLWQHTKELALVGHCKEPQGYKNYAFHNILRYSNPQRLTSLYFRSFILASGLELSLQILPALKTLKLDYVRDLGGDWDLICSFRNLEVLELAESNLQSDHLKNIGNLKKLKVLKLDGCDGLDRSCLIYINTIASGLNVLELSIINDMIKGDDYCDLLTDLRDIERLSICYSEVNDHFFTRAKWKWEKICQLSLRSDYVTDSALEAISSFSSLTKLDIAGCDISDRGLELVSKLINLILLNVGECHKVTKHGLGQISKLKKLRTLNIFEFMKITDSDFLPILTLSSLTSLDLGSCHALTDSSLQSISQRLLLLQWIDVSCVKFTIEGLNHLLDLPYLTDIYYEEYMYKYITPDNIDEFKSKLSDKKGKGK